MEERHEYEKPKIFIEDSHENGGVRREVSFFDLLLLIR